MSVVVTFSRHEFLQGAWGVPPRYPSNTGRDAPGSTPEKPLAATRGHHYRTAMINLYIKPGCPWCVQVESYLQEQGFTYNPIDVITDGDAFDKMQELSGQSSAPTMTVGDLLLADFGVEELVPFLAQHGITAATTE